MENNEKKARPRKKTTALTALAIVTLVLALGSIGYMVYHHLVIGSFFLFFEEGKFDFTNMGFLIGFITFLVCVVLGIVFGLAYIIRGGDNKVKTAGLAAPASLLAGIFGGGVLGAGLIWLLGGEAYAWQVPEYKNQIWTLILVIAGGATMLFNLLTFIVGMVNISNVKKVDEQNEQADADEAQRAEEEEQARKMEEEEKAKAEAEKARLDAIQKQREEEEAARQKQLQEEAEAKRKAQEKAEMEAKIREEVQKEVARKEAEDAAEKERLQREEEERAAVQARLAEQAKKEEEEKKGEEAKKAEEAKKQAAKKPAEKPAEKPAVKKPAPAKKEESSSSPKIYHISQHDNGWQVKAQGGERAVKTFATQAEAIEYAKELAKRQNASVRLHSKKGSFRSI